MSQIRSFLFTFILLALGFIRCAAQDAAAPAPDPDKTLGPGDTVTYSVAEDKAAPVKLRVSDAGFLMVPIVGNVPASGKNCTEVAAQITKRLVPKYYVAATVALSLDTVAPPKAHPPVKVTISGKVIKPGLIEIPFGDSLTVTQAIAKAGGPNNFGALNKVQLKRKNADGTESVFNLNVDPRKGNAKDDKKLQDGDAIDVGAKVVNLTP